MRSALFFFAGCVVACAQGIHPVDNSGESGPFSAWASKSLRPLTSNSGRVDLSPLKQMIGGAKIVALSEAVHGAAEPLLFRNRLLAYLVEEMGFTAIAIESGFTEGQVVHDYVLGAPGDIKSVAKVGIGWTFDRFPQNEALIAWLREYNASPKHPRKVRFYGFDVPGSPGNQSANRGLKTAIEAALDYLAIVDGPAAGELRRRVEPALPYLNVNRSPRVYSQLLPAERDQLTAAVTDTVALFERSAVDYTAASSAEAYWWAYHNAIGAREADNWLRQIPTDPTWKPFSVIAVTDGQTAGRNHAMADNLRWIQEKEGPEAKILVYAARGHLATARYLPLKAGGHGPFDPAGRYMREDMGVGLVNIGNYFGGGSYGCGSETKLEAAAFENVFGSLTKSDFLLDLRLAPPAIKNWLDQPKPILSAGGSGGFQIPVAQAFDIVHFIHNLTPACQVESQKAGR